SAHARHAVAHVLCGNVDVAGKIKFDANRADALAALAGQGLDAFDVVDLLFEAFRDFRLDDPRVRAGIDRRDTDDGWINIRQFADRQARQTDNAEQDHH